MADFSRQYPTLTNPEQAYKAEESIKEQYPQNQEAVSTLSGLLIHDQNQVDSTAYQQVMQNLLSKPGLADFIPKMDDGKLQSLQRVMKKQYEELAINEDMLTAKAESEVAETSIDLANNEAID